jgi:cytosine/adenosine deaminase-related metal-dependent hydrolase
VIRDGAVYIEGDIIRDIGEYREICRRHKADLELGSDRFCIIPGLINSHHHGRGLTMFQRGFDDAPLELWELSYTVDATYPWIDPVNDSLLCALNQLKSGVTTSLCQYYPSEDAWRDVKSYLSAMRNVLESYEKLGVRISLAPAAYDQNQLTLDDSSFLSTLPENEKAKYEGLLTNESEDRTKLYRLAFEKLCKEYRDNDKIRVQLGPSGVPWCSDGLLGEIEKMSRTFDVRCHIHLLETKFQLLHSKKVLKRSYVEHLNKLGLLNSRLSCAHCVWVTRDDIEMMAESGVSVVHNPSSNLRLSSGLAPVPEMINHGIDVALGLDNMSMNDDEDFFQEMRLCSLIHRKPGITGARFSASKIFDAATCIGASATGFGEKIGSLEMGRQADLVLIDYERMSMPGTSTKHNFTETLLRRCKPEHVDTVMVAGEIVLRDSKSTRIDEKVMLEHLAKANLPDRPDQETGGLSRYVRNFYSSWERE